MTRSSLRPAVLTAVVALLVSCSPRPAPAPAAAAATTAARPATASAPFTAATPSSPVRTPVPFRGNDRFDDQPEEAKLWAGARADLLVRRAGRLVTDPDWPGQHLLDTSTPAKRQALMGVVGPWVDGCAAGGFDAVEPDNLDSWTRSHGLLTRALPDQW